MNSINIIQFILEYSNTLLFLFLEKNKHTDDHDYEYTDFIKNMLNISNTSCSTNSYGNTRCYTTTEVINMIFGVTTPIIEINNAAEQNIFLIKKKIHDYVRKYGLMKISINPDHIFYILYTPDNEWYLISSWIYLYNLNIIKIDFDDFIDDFLKIFFVNKNNKNNDFYTSYERFLSRYFFYKSIVLNNSLFITNEIESLRDNMLQIHAVDFIYKDYYGRNGNHEIEFYFYEINFDNISFLISTYLTNVLKHCILNFNYFYFNNKISYKNKMTILIKQWLTNDQEIYSQKNNTDSEYFDNQIDILTQSIIELIDFADCGNLLSYNNIGNDDYLFSGKKNMITRSYAKKILSKLNFNNHFNNQYGGKLSKIVEKIDNNSQNKMFECIFKYWKIISKKYNLIDILVSDKIDLPIKNISVNIIKQIILQNNYAQVYKIHYLQDSKEKISYIVVQKNNYVNEPPKPTYLFIDNENEAIYNTESSRLIMINFNINNLQDLLLQRYVIIGNTFYREFAKNITFIKFEVYQKNSDLKQIKQKINSSMDDYLLSYSRGDKNMTNNYSRLIETLMHKVEFNKNKFHNVYFSEIGIYSDVLAYFENKEYYDSDDYNLHNMYYPFADSKVEENNTIENYKKIF